MDKYSGKVEYGARAFEQDADLAMRGDIVRGLIELITNSDDAYGLNPGKILIRIDETGESEFPVQVSVHDHALGLDADGLRECFAVLGGENARSEARGLLGRGAKDVAGFGFVEFAAIKDNLYSKLHLQSGEFLVDPINEPATDAGRSALVLGADQNGLTATIGVRKNHRVPSAAFLQTELSRHAQLRDLVTRRSVRIEDSRGKKFAADIPAIEVVGEVIVDKEIYITGYEVPVRLTLRRLPQRDSKNLSATSDQGLLIKSGVSIFENSWFGMEGVPESNFFAGMVDAPQIAEIIRAFDKGEDLGGNIRLLSRDRDGLTTNHPYRKALARAVVSEIKPIFEKLAQELNSQKKQGEKLSRDFKTLGNALRREVEKAINDIDDQEIHGAAGINFEDFYLIPGARKAKTGETLTFLARSTKEPLENPVANIEYQIPEGSLISIDASEEKWKFNEQLNVWDRRIFVTAGSVEGIGSIRVDMGDAHAKAHISVSDVVEPELVKPADDLKFDTDVASVAPLKRRHLILLAPIIQAERKVLITSSGYDFESIPTEVVLRPDASGRYASAKVTCIAKSQEGVAEVYAQIVGLVHQAHCKLNVTQAANRSGLDFSFEVSAHKQPNHRSRLELKDGKIVILTYALHPSFNGLFGAYSEEEKKFDAEDTLAARTMISEIIGEEIADYLTVLRYEKYPEQLNDAPLVLIQRNKYQMQFQKVIHKVLSGSDHEDEI